MPENIEGAARWGSSFESGSKCLVSGVVAQKCLAAAPVDVPAGPDRNRNVQELFTRKKRLIVFDNEGNYMVMFNPEIVKKSGPYQAEEGCLSLSGIRRAKRWKSIKVQYQNEKFQIRFKTSTGWTAQIIQHEIDHCEGLLI